MVVPTCLPLVIRRCHACRSERFQASGKFRVNANHKLIDAWLLVLCISCGDTVKLTVLERTKVRTIPPELLDRLQDNDSALIAKLLQNPDVVHRNRIALDWNNAWRLDTGTPDHLEDEIKAIEVSVRFAAPVLVRPTHLVAEGLGLSRAEVEKLITEGKLISSVRLGGKLSSDFTFTLKHEIQPDVRPESM